MSDISIIVQGPANTISLENLDNYRKFGSVIISCYDDEDNDKILHNYNLDNEVVIKSIVPYIKNVFNGGNSFLQAWTTLQGLQSCKTKLFVKVRSDEYFSDISPIINQIRKDPELFTSCNIFAKGHNAPFCPSDHMFGGRVDYFKKGLSFFRDICIFSPVPPDYHNLHGSIFKIPYKHHLLTEQSLFLSFLWGKRVIHQIKKDNHAQITYDNLEIVDIDEMGPYLWTCSIYNQKGRYNNSKRLYSCEEPCLKSKEDFWKGDYEFKPPGL